MPDLPERKPTRLKNYDYSSAGAYFITICTEGRKKILSEIYVGTGVLDGPRINLTDYGKIAEKYIKNINAFYDNLSVINYIIMPNHIHLLVEIKKTEKCMKNICGQRNKSEENGPSGTPVPTNSAIARFVSTFKRFCNKEYGKNIWQYRSNDHIIRNETEYEKIWNYIEHNADKWEEDCFYC
ncbi:MAG: hypothetical protein IKJ27_03375 [Clostridia bacterium]|nr:hypothetical protein [Clostridia bacterium]